MAKKTTEYRCSNCGATFPTWLGQCKTCQEWGTLEEVEMSSAQKTSSTKTKKSTFTVKNAVSISQQAQKMKDRLPTGVDEFDRVLGGGLMSGGITLLAGAPGCGKSTLTLMVGHNVAQTGKKVLIASAEETENQIANRAMRIGADGSENLYIVADSNLSNIISYIDELQPDLIVADSLQTIFSPEVEGSAGGTAQVKEVASSITNVGKSTETPILIIGHVTKDEKVAGPRTVEHLVDTVLNFQSTGTGALRMLRAEKNRYGSTDEVGCFEHAEDGLHEVKDPSGILLDTHEGSVSGIGISITMEGNRPMPVEVQALTVSSNLPVPRRVSSGIDHARNLMIQAVMDKHAHARLGNVDVYVSTTGGIRVKDTCVDMATVVAIASAKHDMQITSDIAAIGEVSLTGELRRVSYMDRRIEEARRLGFDMVLVPNNTDKALIAKARKNGLVVVPLPNVEKLCNFIAKIAEERTEKGE